MNAKGEALEKDMSTVECVPNAPPDYSDREKYKYDIIWNQIGNNKESRFNMPNKSWDDEHFNQHEI